jgi:TetR/AcrR family transcriptional repressor of nem operon
MAPRPRPARDPEGVRARICEAALAGFARDGFGATSVDRICAQAGVTKGAFFHHFRSKDALVELLLAEHTERRLRALQEAPFRSEPDPVERIAGFVEHLVSLALAHEGPPVSLLGLAAAELGRTPRIAGLIAAAQGALVADLAALVEEARAAARPDARFDSERVAAVVVAAWEGAWLAARVSGDAGIVVTHLTTCRAWIRGLFGRGPYAMQVTG